MTPVTLPPQKRRPLSRGPERMPFVRVGIPFDEFDYKTFRYREVREFPLLSILLENGANKLVYAEIWCDAVAG